MKRELLNEKQRRTISLRNMKKKKIIIHCTRDDRCHESRSSRTSEVRLPTYTEDASILTLLSRNTFSTGVLSTSERASWLLAKATCRWKEMNVRGDRNLCRCPKKRHQVPSNADDRGAVKVQGKQKWTGDDSSRARDGYVFLEVSSKELL